MHNKIPQTNNRILHKQISTETQAFQQQTELKILRQIRQKARQIKQVMQHTHSVSETDQTLQNNHMFTYIHSTQEEGWQPAETAIATYTNFFSSQQEHNSITSPNKRMTVTSLLQQSKAEDLIKDIIKEEDHQIKSGNTTPLINNLEMQNVFKDKDKERGDSIIDLIKGLEDLLSLKTRAVWDA